MRQRLRPLRDKAMARRPGEPGRFTLTRRERTIAGWIAAIVLIIGLAIVVGVLGGNADGDPVVPDSSPAASSGTADIVFGTVLAEAGDDVPEAARTDRFASGDGFAYVVPGVPPPATVYVEVERTAGGPPGIVQEAAPDGLQTVPPERAAIAFVVPADNLLAAFGPGDYTMRIFADPVGEPIAEGRFTLVGPADSTAPASP